MARYQPALPLTPTCFTHLVRGFAKISSCRQRPSTICDRARYPPRISHRVSGSDTWSCFESVPDHASNCPLTGRTNARESYVPWRCRDKLHVGPAPPWENGEQLMSLEEETQWMNRLAKLGFEVRQRLCETARV